MMLGSKAPNHDAYGLFRATHSHNPPPIFAYRGIYIPLLCSYRGGSQGLSPTYERAHVVRPFDPGIIIYDINYVGVRRYFTSVAAADKGTEY